MQVKIFSIVVLALLGGQCFAKITIEKPKQSKFVSHLINATVCVLTSCYGETVKEIGIHGDSTELLYSALLSKDIIPVISIDNTTQLEHNSIWDRSRHKLQLFAIVANSTAQFQKILEKIKNSRWWNHMASFLIVTWTTELDNDCSKAVDFLQTAWQMNLLNVNFMCVNKTEEMLIYTYNPYTIKASDTWKLEKTYSDKYHHSWSMFVQEFKKDKDICNGLNFDKTKDLGGWKIPSSAQEDTIFWRINENKTGIDSFEGLEGIICKILFRAMNANVKLKSYRKDAIFIESNNKGEIVKGIVLDVIKKTSDIVLNSYYQEVFMNLTITYTHWDGGLGVVTRHSGYLSQLSKINSAIDINSRYGLCVVILLTIIFFKFFLRQSLISAILNTLRLTCNSCLTKSPKRSSARIYLGALFCFQITIIALYQGQLASLLTKEVEKKNVNTMEDLRESNHKIYGYEILASYFRDPKYKNRFIGHVSFDCEHLASRDSSAACVRDWDALISVHLLPDLHLSSNMIIEAGCVYAIREDWPLEKRVNEILGIMISADIIRRTLKTYSNKALSFHQYIEKMKMKEGPKVLTLRQLSFAFAILGIGIGFATVAFIFEIIVAYR